MKVLLDECVNQDFRLHLAGHEVFTAAYLGWAGVQNGNLLRLAASERFCAMITRDRGIAYQHNLATLPLSVISLRAASNKLTDLLPFLPKVEATLAALAEPKIIQLAL